MHSDHVPGDTPEERARMRALMKATRMPPNEVGVPVPGPLVLARTADAAVLLGALRVFSTGVQLALQTRTRQNLPPREIGPGGARFPGLRGTEVMLGVEFSDGRRASNLGGPRGFLPTAASGAVSLVRAGGSASGRTADSTFYLTPLPPDGPLTLVVAAPDLDIPEHRTELDATALRQAAGRVEVLWVEPEPVEPGEPPVFGVPEPPAGGWFDRHRR
ncbi:hypothetical protein [Nakamurella deserti]|uniref:hypothetical protein n=1 Tax=Nakamurella deserti TaxID=2164074 RepID=UPI000DBE4D41|nr:hypothetical protein [Nakamurella deserti]